MNHTIMDRTPTIEEIPYMVNVFPGDTVTVFHPFRTDRQTVFYFVADRQALLREVTEKEFKKFRSEKRMLSSYKNGGA